MRTLSWYGDDFTGSTDALQALAPFLDAVLFLGRPDATAFAPFQDYEAFGLAGATRSESPEAMELHLPEDLAWLRGLNAAACHYKICSTFDSSPTVGSIGRAIEIGHRIFGGRFVPLVVGAPPLRRYTFFGHLFAAAAGGVIHRIDRHPAMSRHAVTPMREADLRLHLREQTTLPVDLHDAAAPDDRYAAGATGAVLIDVFDDATLRRAGRLLWDQDRQPFLVGSSGIEYALLAHWDRPCRAVPALAPADRVVVLSGSCSPNTQCQIAHAGANGFRLIPIDPLDGAGDNAAVQFALDALSGPGSGVVLYSSETRIETLDTTGRRALGERSGRLLARVLDASAVRRAIVCGGDTSSHAGSQLGIDALTFLTHLAPGAPLCQAWSRAPRRHGLEIVFKGGQVGGDNFFTLTKGDRST
ncbi:MAG: four-carbon acid sugar kinase family protein [Acidobacteria bacterium]|nr:four-carbon acid sugar kinase family protein [Acidobacteriota bacterium]